jgi:hypothetical protein
MVRTGGFFRNDIIYREFRRFINETKTFDFILTFTTFVILS